MIAGKPHTAGQAADPKALVACGGSRETWGAACSSLAAGWWVVVAGESVEQVGINSFGINPALGPPIRPGP